MRPPTTKFFRKRQQKNQKKLTRLTLVEPYKKSITRLWFPITSWQKIQPKLQIKYQTWNQIQFNDVTLPQTPPLLVFPFYVYPHRGKRNRIRRVFCNTRHEINFYLQSPGRNYLVDRRNSPARTSPNKILAIDRHNNNCLVATLSPVYLALKIACRTHITR